MSSPPALDMHPVLRMQQLGSIVVVQPWWNGTVSGQALSCDLETGTLALVDHPPVDKNFVSVFGLLGMTRIGPGAALVVITAVQDAANLRGHPLLRVTGTKVLVHQDGVAKNWSSKQRRLLHLLRLGVDPKKYGGQLYYSVGGDCTLTQQRHADACKNQATYASTPSWRRAEHAFFWNYALAKPLLDAGMERFVPTAFVGFVEQLQSVDFSRDGQQCEATITLIARRSGRRAGTRQWRRGADMGADVANFVESEQIICFADGSLEASFVQVRGSIPLLWSQTPDLKYKIPIKIAAPSKCESIVSAHARHLAARYGRVTAINLANQTGREGKLSAAYAAAAGMAESQGIPFRLVPFDFHKQCGATNYANLEVLWRDVASDFTADGYWHVGSAGSSGIQKGVFRVNCIDTLDRTNVVQGMLARKALMRVLRQKGLLKNDGETLASAFSAAEIAFRVMWADHGDEISRQYAGTGAMKSAFTRTGKRDLAGLLDDGRKSLTRYFLNNFRDGEKQDALDLVTGTFSSSDLSNTVKPLQQGSPALPLIAIAVMLATAIGNAQLLAADGKLMSSDALRHVWGWVLLAFVTLRLVFWYGRHLVDAPVLRPDLACPWAF